MIESPRFYPSYGVPNISKLRAANMAYVDKTRFIQQMEDSRGLYVFLVRPRRFGKTMFSSVLCAYYDEASQVSFEKNFAETAILKNPTPAKGAFRVVQFDFSGIDTANPKNGFVGKICNGLTDFYERYPIPEVLELSKNPPEDPSALIDTFFRIVRTASRKPLYVIIDEYDEMLNEILSGNSTLFQQLVGDGGFVKSFYASLKSAISNIVDRIFITGVLPISLDSMTSGFNLAKNFSLREEFADAFGFTEEELSRLISETVDLKAVGLTKDYILKRMKSHYNGYRFGSGNCPAVFNPSMCLYYLEELIESNREPDVLIDPNVDVGAGKLMSILEMASTAQIETIVDAVFQDRPIQMVQGNLGEPINLARRKHLTESEIVAVLFYMGFLTRSSSGDGFFVCPNQAMKANFARIFFKRRGLAFSPNWAFVRQCLERLAKGDEKALFQYVADQFASDAGVHFSANLSEKIFHTALYTYVKLSPDFEPFVEKEAGGFVDLLLLTTEHSTSEYSYVVELKYLSHEQAKKAGEIGKKLNDAKEQLIRYARSKNLDVLRHKPYRFLRVLYIGVELKACEDITEQVEETLTSETENDPQGCATS